MKLDVEVLHTGSVPVNLAVTVVDSLNSTWGFKEYYMLVAACHSYCSSCTSGLNTACSACASPYWLSATTCSASCLAGYGMSSTPRVCVLCSLYCAQCEGTATNCSSCQASGLYESFLNGSTCLVSCPVGKVADASTHECKSCSNSNCDACSASNLTSCLDCNSATFWLSYDCLVSCPSGYF